MESSCLYNQEGKVYNTAEGGWGSEAHCGSDQQQYMAQFRRSGALTTRPARNY